MIVTNNQPSVTFGAGTFTNLTLGGEGRTNWGEKIIPSSVVLGFHGMTLAVSGYGAAWSVDSSDVDGGVMVNWYVKNGGSFKVAIVYATDDNTTGKTYGGHLYLFSRVAGGAGYAWDTFNAVDWNLAGLGATVFAFSTYGTAFTVADDSYVAAEWNKTDNAGGATGGFNIPYLVLIRQ